MHFHSIDLHPEPKRAHVVFKTVMNSNDYYANVIDRIALLAYEIGFDELVIVISSSSRGYLVGFKTRRRNATASVSWTFPRTVDVLGPAALEELLVIELTNARRLQEAIP